MTEGLLSPVAVEDRAEGRNSVSGILLWEIISSNSIRKSSISGSFGTIELVFWAYCLSNSFFSKTSEYFFKVRFD